MPTEDVSNRTPKPLKELRSRKGENRFLSLVKRELIARNHSAADVAGYYTVPTLYGARSYDLPFVYFVNRGCSFDHLGACTECNFGRGSPVDDERLLELVGNLVRGFQGRPALYVTPSGSMFDDFEVPERVRLEIFRVVREAGFELLCTESRPEFLTEAKIGQALEALGPGVNLEVGIGLETVNDWVRRNCINKMLPLSSIAEAVELCKRCGASTYTHVLTKPPFLGEYEAVEDAVATINWAFEHGVDRIGLALTNIKPGTVTRWPAAGSTYKPPAFWSVIRILLSVRPEWRTRIGLFGFDSAVTIELPAANCTVCSPHIRSLLQAFCYTRDSHFLQQAEEYPCQCRSAWLEEMRPPEVPLRDRVAQYYEQLGRGVLGDVWWLENQECVLADLDSD